MATPTSSEAGFNPTRQLTWTRLLRSDFAFLVSLGLVKVAVHFLCNLHDGYFRDEYYYIACSNHLDWGYVDHPPLSILLLRIARFAFGDSVFAIRLLAVLAGAIAVALTALVASAMGGSRFAQAFAALTVIIAPVFLAMDSFYSMNALDQVFWAGAVYLFVLILKTGNGKLWLLFGLVAGLGMQNKIGVLFLGFGIAVGLLLTSSRRQFLRKEIWIGGALAVLISLPYILWQIPNDFATLDFMHNATTYKNLPRSPLQFLLDVTIQVHPLNLPICLMGLGFLFFHPEGKRYRPVAWAFLAVMAVLAGNNGKAYYLAPAMPMLLAPGAIFVEKLTARPSFRWVRFSVVGLLILAGLAVAPLALPIVPAEKCVAYQKALGLQPPQEERGSAGEIPQHLSDRFGWVELVEAVTRAYRGLDAEERKQCAIFADNYGEAGAIEFHGNSLGLPPVICAHNNYFLWGFGGATGEVMICVGFDPDELEPAFEEVELAEVHKHPYAREREVPIHVCRKPKGSLAEWWPKLKHFI